MKKNIIDWMIEKKYAKNNFQAWNISKGLDLISLRGNLESQQERVILYRAWRDSKTFPDKDTKSCYEMAISGRRVPELNFTTALNSESK